MGFFLTLALWAVMLVLSDLLRPKPENENIKPAGLGDFRFPTATEGRRVPLIWGTVRIEGPNVVWYGDLIQEAITEKVKTGLFSSEKVVRGYRYHLGVQSALCMGPVDDITRIWIGDDLVLDELGGTPITPDTTFTINEPKLFGGEELGQGGVVGTLRFHGGSSTQVVSTYLTEFQKEPPTTGDTPAYRDLCYIAPDVDPTLLGTSTNIKAWKYEARRFPNGLSLTGGKEQVVGGCNPMNAFYEVLNNSDWGYGVSASDIDTSNFSTAADTLVTEGNGFSFLLDREIDASELIRQLEEQVDGILFVNPLTAKWQIKLIRADYDIMTVPELTDDNVRDVPVFTQGTWEDTTNQVRIPFNQQDDEYKDTFGFAQDMANVRILGTNISSSIVHGGIKDKALANAIAWRELRTLSTPLAQATFIVDRSLYGVMPGDVVAFTSTWESFEFTRLPMRVREVDYGDLLDGRIKIQATQDIFFSSTGVFGNPPKSAWVSQEDTFVAFPVDQQLAFEAPYGLNLRDPDSTSPLVDKVYAAARRQSIEVAFLMVERNASGTPAGAYTQFGEVFAFAKIGELQSTLDPGSAYPLTSLVITPTPDTQTELVDAFPTGADLNEIGTELLTLCMVNDEFFLVESAETVTTNVQLNNVYRGVLDSVQGAHAANDEVFLLFVGGGISDSSIVAGNNVDVKLLPESALGELEEASATAISFQMDDRSRRPIPPASFDLNSVTMDTTSVDLDGSGSGEDVGILVDEIVRRDYRTVNEVEAVTNDAAVLASDFPTANSTEVEVEMRDGVTALTTTTGLSGTSTTMRQLDILAGLDTTTLPSSLTIALRESHTLDGTVYKSRDWFTLTFTIVSEFIGKHAFGELDENETSTIYEVQSGQSGTDHVFNLSTAFTVGDVEYRLDGGSWLTLISAGGTGPGTIPNASLSVGTDIEVHHLSTDTTPQKLLTMTVSGTEEAYAVLIS